MNETLRTKLFNLWSELPAVAKDALNEHGNFKYYSKEGLLSVLRPYLREQKLNITVNDVECEQGVITRKGNDVVRTKLKREVTLTDVESGESHVITVFGEGIDSTGFSIAKAQTSSLKRALTELFMVSDGIEPEITDPEVTDELKKGKEKMNELLAREHAHLKPLSEMLERNAIERGEFVDYLKFKGSLGEEDSYSDITEDVVSKVLKADENKLNGAVLRFLENRKKGDSNG